MPEVRVINRYNYYDELPSLPDGRIVVFIGSHKKFRPKDISAVEEFCEKTGAVVFCDYSSNYRGKYAFFAYLLSSQAKLLDIFNNVELVIHLGEETADLVTLSKLKSAKETWRVSEDGEMRDAFKNLSNVFEMREYDFFNYYCKKYSAKKSDTTFYDECISSRNEVEKKIPELPFSNIYTAQKIIPLLPQNSIVYFGASNTIRAWSYFSMPQNVSCNGNMGCRGIDGTLSSAVGVSLADKNKICFCILGDLSFFYDMNVLGNRHISSNLRVLMINNGGGSLFKQTNAPGLRIGKENTDLYIAAAGHYGNKSRSLVKHYAEDLGFEYLSASDKDEFEAVYTKFVDSKISDKPIMFEVFTDDMAEKDAFDIMRNLVFDQKALLKKNVKKILGEKGLEFVNTKLIKKK